MKADWTNIEPVRLRNSIVRVFNTRTGDRFGWFYPSFKSQKLNVMVDDGHTTGWEHVSVSTNHRCPNWEEMDFVKNLFWDKHEVVMQLHVSDENKVDVMKYCLHLWKPRNEAIPVPPKLLV